MKALQEKPIIDPYMERLDPSLSLIDHYLIEISLIITDHNITKELYEKEDLRTRKGYPYYRHEYPDHEKRDIALFQRSPSLYLPRKNY